MFNILSSLIDNASAGINYTARAVTGHILLTVVPLPTLKYTTYSEWWCSLGVVYLTEVMLRVHRDFVDFKHGTL